jgi:hypothetical protein
MWRARLVSHRLLVMLSEVLSRAVWQTLMANSSTHVQPRSHSP